MQKFAVAIAAVPTLTGACAFAADMAVKAPPLPSLLMSRRMLKKAERRCSP